MKKLILHHHFWAIWILGISLMSCSTKFKVVEENGAKKIYNIKYGTHQQQRMDVFLPANYLANSPAVVIVHGGSWRRGNKQRMIMIQNFLFKNNIVTININYRLLKNQDTYKKQVEDIGAAVMKSNEMANSWNLLPHNYVLLGESSGAHISLLYGYNHPEEIKKLISMSAPTDFYSEKYRKSTYHFFSKSIFQKVVGEKYKKNPEVFRQASPIENVSNIPTLIFQGDRDLLVNKNQGLALDSVLTSKKIPHQFILMKNSGHMPRFVKRKRDSIIFPAILSFIKNDFN